MAKVQTKKFNEMTDEEFRKAASAIIQDSRDHKEVKRRLRRMDYVEEFALRFLSLPNRNAKIGDTVFTAILQGHRETIILVNETS